jgi:arginine deiminase
MVFLRSTLDGNYDAWLCIIRHIASLLRNESMTRAMRKMAASLMSIDIWLKDISTECQKAFQDGPKDQVLPPLVYIRFSRDQSLLMSI